MVWRLEAGFWVVGKNWFLASCNFQWLPWNSWAMVTFFSLCLVLSLLSSLAVLSLVGAAVGLHCCTWAFSGCRARALLQLWCRVSQCGGFFCLCWHQPQGVWASVVATRGPWSVHAVVVAHGLSCSETCGIFLDQAGGFLTTGPPGKSVSVFSFASVL